MKHADLIKAIHTEFKNNWIDSTVYYDSTVEITDKNPYISLRYSPNYSANRYLGNTEGSFNFSGTLRVFIYEKNPTKSMELIDKVVVFLKNQVRNGVKYRELEGIGAPERNTTGDLYVSFVDFNACLIH